MSNKLEVISAATAQKLEQHETNLRAFMAGEHKSAAEFFAYAFLTGKEMLATKDTLAHGNSGDANAGLMSWLQVKFAKTPYRTCASRMEFAADIVSKAATLPPLKKRPLMLTNGEITDKDRTAMLQIIPLVMDGKSMTRFMRDCRLLRDPKKAKPTKRPNLSKQEENKAKAEQAKRVWKIWRGDTETGWKVISRLETDDLKKSLEISIETGNKIREALKKRGIEQKATEGTK
jgi:hypothetical protein